MILPWNISSPRFLNHVFGGRGEIGMLPCPSGAARHAVDNLTSLGHWWKNHRAADTNVIPISPVTRNHSPLSVHSSPLSSSRTPSPRKRSRERGGIRGRSAMAGSDLLRPDPPCPGLAIVIMGVSGCGKSTVAAMLADALGCGFVEADNYHSKANKDKMSKGVPLNDEDRLPWLDSLRNAIEEPLGRGEDVTVSCSALLLKYREVLRQGDKDYRPGSYETCRVKFVCLEASAEVIAQRVARRAAEGGHFMPASLVQSQLDLLEIDSDERITVVDATVPANAIVEATIAQFRDELASTAMLSADN